MSSLSAPPRTDITALPPLNRRDACNRIKADNSSWPLGVENANHLRRVIEVKPDAEAGNGRRKAAGLANHAASFILTEDHRLIAGPVAGRAPPRLRWIRPFRWQLVQHGQGHPIGP
eukprot:scaffold576_cov260-Pinguiococcus_pyrenoidosus.AAC.58